MYLNVDCAKINRDIFKLKDEIQNTIFEQKSDIIGLGECDIPNKDLAKEFQINGFETIVHETEGKVRILLLVRKEVKHSVIKPKHDMPLISIEVANNDGKCLVISSLYREWLKTIEEQR